MLEKLMQYCKNYFVRTLETGTYTIANGSINATGTYAIGQYIRIKGSLLNDGVYQFANTMPLQNEVFDGSIYGLAVPKDFVELSTTISTFVDKNPQSALTSESFSGYSYAKATDINGAPMSWQSVFASDLKPYKKMYESEVV